MDAIPDTDEQLIAQAVGGDAIALKILLTNYRVRVRERVAARLPIELRSGLDPDDVVQDAYVHVFRQIGTFRSRGEDSLFRWVLTIALRRLRDAIKRQQAAKRGGDAKPIQQIRPGPDDSMIALLDLLAAPGRTPSQSVARQEAIAAVQAALEELPPDFRQAVRLVCIEGQTIAAAALKMGRTERAIENLCYKAKGRMREYLGSRSRFLSSSD